MSKSFQPKLLHLSPLLPLSSLPSHPALRSSQSAATAAPQPSPTSFAQSLLAEGTTFIDTVFPAFTPRGTKRIKMSDAGRGPGRGAGDPDPSPAPPAAHVALLEHSVGDAEAGERVEPWFMRRSRHAGTAARGDAAWGEFDAGLRREHSRHECEYTPSIRDAVRVCAWGGGADGAERGIGPIEGWDEVEMAVYEMLHSLPSPLRPRLFPILVLTALRSRSSSAGTESSTGRCFVVLTLPLPALSSVDAAKHSGRSGFVHARYAAVERVREIEGPGGEIEWEAATTSDACGVLPRRLQKWGVVGAIAKDVALFLRWVEERRKDGDGDGDGARDVGTE